ncbi:phosphotransferase family protein [Leptolyngbya sp. AN02str]|uniref:phosphotransferase family protein n=1 Tax=Leptolyngbya sp. AN02str TaxID=3423363 RepID=UPI003D31999A
MSTSALDPNISFLADTLDRQQAQVQLQPLFPNLREVTAATLVRHKLGRRALVEYHLTTVEGSLTILGKIRAKGTDWNSYKVQQALWNQGFAANRSDGFSVPEPLGVLPNWQMWLQRKVSGIPATDVLPTAAGVSLARRIAALAHKLHHTPVASPKNHTQTDELRILHTGLLLVADQHPHWRSRIETILQHCDTAAATIYPPTHPLIHPCTHALIHRDFYPDQVLVDRDRLWLVDLDLCCHGDPVLDIGNFIAHITEQSLRQMGDPSAMHEQEVALREAFIQACLTSETSDHHLDANQLRRAIEHYTVLSLVRHIHISNRITARQHLTERILTLCEIRLQQLE